MIYRRLLCTTLLLTTLALPAGAATVIQTDQNVVRLGDVFHNIGSKEDIVIGNAPQPGQDMILGPRALLQLAKTHSISWKPGTGDNTVIVRRASQSLSISAQEKALTDALVAKGLHGDFGLQFTTPLQEMSIATDDDAAITVDNLHYAADSQAFSATLTAGAKQAQVSGHIVQMISVPVLKSPVQKGQVISAANLDFLSVKSESVKGNLVTNPDSVIGMVATKMLEPNKPMRLNDIAAQRLVERGQEITILYAAGPLQLTAKGKAMQHGQADDVVQVVNLGSNLTLDARVTGNGVVTVY